MIAAVARAAALPALLLLGACGDRAEKQPQEMSAQDVAKQLSGVKIQPGQWEATNVIVSASGPGLPADVLQRMVGRKTVKNNCVTPEQAARPQANFLAAQENSDCTYQDFQMAGGKMSGQMTCSGGEMPGDVVMKMNGDYGPQSYDMVMDMTTAGLPGGMALTIKARTTGRRVGDCA